MEQNLLELLEESKVLITLDIDAHGQVFQNLEKLSSFLGGTSQFLPSTNLPNMIYEEDRPAFFYLLSQTFSSGRATSEQLRFCIKSSTSTQTIPCEAFVMRSFGSFPLKFLVLPKQRSPLPSMKAIQGHKLMNLGALSAGIAHDLNNLFTGVLTFTNLLQRSRLNRREEGYLCSIETSVNQATTLTSSVLQYLRADPFSSSETDPIPCINNNLTISQALFRQGITLNTSITDKKGSIPISYSDLSQTVLNLLLNARDAIKGRGQIFLRAHYKNIGKKRYFILEIEDSGIGIPKQYADSIYASDFTTKAPSKGTGIGLSIIKNILDKIDGKIVMGSIPEEKTIFTLFIPSSPSNERSMY